MNQLGEFLNHLMNCQDF